MKIIDLLNKIANGEEIPKRIIYDQFVYVWNSKIENYQREIDETTILNWDHITINCLNEPVEILNKILEEKKIPEKMEEYIHTDSLNYNQCNYMFEKLTNKYNELINYLDYLKSKGE